MKKICQHANSFKQGVRIGNKKILACGRQCQNALHVLVHFQRYLSDKKSICYFIYDISNHRFID